MATYTAPGVYVEEKSVLPPSVSGVSTSIPAFVGYTAQAGVNNELVNKAVRISTIKEYQETFGTVENDDKKFIAELDVNNNIVNITKPDLSNTLFYNMQLFFNNGGGSCYIVSVDKTDRLTKEKENFEAAIDALTLEDEPTLIVIVQNNMPTITYTALVEKVLRQCHNLQDRFGIFDVVTADNGKFDLTELENYRGAISLDKDYLKYGAAYYPNLQTLMSYEFDDESVIVQASTGDQVALSDPSIKDNNTALYNEIIKILSEFKLILPPSAAVAGVYAATDRDRGVWKAPANVGISSVSGPAFKLTSEQNGLLNIDAQSGKSINAIRLFSGKGTLVWGARTLAGNDNEWRYVPVRRLFNYVEESIEKASSFAVFEPNEAITWLKVRAVIESFLDNIWRQGALAGGKAEDAYFVQVGLGTTMTPDDIANGRLLIKVGLAAVRPAEFIVLEFTHKLQ